MPFLRFLQDNFIILPFFVNLSTASALYTLKITFLSTYIYHKICPLINSLSYVLILPHQIIPCQSHNMKITKAQTIASKKKGVVFFVQVAAAFSKRGGRCKWPKWRRQSRQLGFSCNSAAVVGCVQALHLLLGMNSTLLAFSNHTRVLVEVFVSSGSTLAKWRRPGFFLFLFACYDAEQSYTTANIGNCLAWREVSLSWADETQLVMWWCAMVLPTWRKYASRLREEYKLRQRTFPQLD